MLDINQGMTVYDNWDQSKLLMELHTNDTLKINEQINIFKINRKQNLHSCLLVISMLMGLDDGMHFKNVFQ
jgi:hypothetical protein